MLNAILLCLAVLAFLAIVLEDVIHLNKAKSTLFLGTLCWILLFILWFVLGLPLGPGYPVQA